MLPAAFVLSWLPALAAAYRLRPWGQPAFVLSAAGPAGGTAAACLAATLVLLSAAYLAALRRPPGPRTLALAAFGSLGAALLMPVMFSADAYAYAYYGDLALRGMNPYSHGAAPTDALAAAAVAAWDGRVPPRCVYGPLAVAVAAAADVLGVPAGVAGQLLAQRLAAAAAFAVTAVYVVRLFPNPRAQAAILLNPVVIWSVAEGHNDAALAACVLAGLAYPNVRPALLAAGALMKAPAILAWRTLRGFPAVAVATGLTVAGYVPLAFAAAAAGPEAAAGGTASWFSPVGLLATVAGRLPALALAIVGIAAAAYVLRRLPPVERTTAYALAGWFALPNAYPWYAVWTVPLAARNLSSPWSRALLTAALFAPVRAVCDAVGTRLDTPGAISSFHLGMIALEYLPPLLALGMAGSRFGRRAATAVALAASLTLGEVTPAGAQSAVPSPQPAPAPPTPTAPAIPSSAVPTTGESSPRPSPPATPPSETAPIAAPQSLPSSPPSPSAATPPPTSGPAPAAPSPSPPVNPFSYIINPPPTPATNPDGPHILQVAINDRRIHAGGPLLVRVVTSANVVGVEARALGRFIAIPQNAPGIFALAYTMPGGIPFWLLNRNYDIVIAAATADGRQTSVSFPMLLLR